MLGNGQFNNNVGKYIVHIFESLITFLLLARISLPPCKVFALCEEKREKREKKRSRKAHTSKQNRSDGRSTGDPAFNRYTASTVRLLLSVNGEAPVSLVLVSISRGNRFDHAGAPRYPRRCSTQPPVTQNHGNGARIEHIINCSR